MGVRRNFSRGGQSRHFAYPFQVVEDATQMDVHKTPHPFYITKKMPNVTATVADSVCFLRKFYTKPGFFKGVLETRFGSLELEIGYLELEKIIKENIWRSKHL